MSTTHIDACPVCQNSDFRDFEHIVDHSVSGEVFLVQQCQNCQLRFTQDQPDANTIGPYYASEDYISHTDTGTGLINRLYHVVRNYMLNSKTSLITRHKASGRILDLGAGTGYFLAHMLKSGWDVVGLEPDKGARTVAAKRFNLNFKTPERLPAQPSKSFDIITMWHVLEHVHTLDQYLRTLHRILKDDGYLFIAVPNYTSFDSGFYRVDWAAYDIPRHLWHFAPSTIRTLLERYDFEMVGRKTMPFDAFYVSLLSEKYRGNKLGLIRGGLVGALSNIRALFNHDRASSVIYIARKSRQSSSQ